MQILFITEEIQILNFLSGLHAEAIMPIGSVEINGVAENSFVTVICSGESVHYSGTIVNIDSAYSTGSDGKWLSLRFIVRRNGASIQREAQHDRRPADA